MLSYNSSTGIGRSIAIRLAKDGFTIAINDLASNASPLSSTANAIRATSPVKVWEVLGDVSKEEEVEKMVNNVVAQLGGLDVMVANAGIAILQPFIECRLRLSVMTDC